MVAESGQGEAATAAELGLAQVAAIKGVEDLAPLFGIAVAGHPQSSPGLRKAVDGLGRALTVQHLPDLKFTPKLEALRQATGFECDWIAFRMPFEAALFLRESAARIAEFLDSWDELSALVKQLGLPLNAECHEIALAAAKSGVNIRVNKELLSRVFKHHILNHDSLMRLHEEAGLRP